MEDNKNNDAQEILKKMNSSEKGLSESEVQQRLIKYGPNALVEKKTNPILKF
ncbi:MAG: cation-transporting P-type ATPase [Saprospiraceae bacterium]